MERFFSNIFLTTSENYSNEKTKAAQYVLNAAKQRENNPGYTLPICILKPDYGKPKYDTYYYKHILKKPPPIDIFNTHMPGTYGSQLDTGEKIFYERDFDVDEREEKKICRNFHQLRTPEENSMIKYYLQMKEREIKNRNAALLAQQRIEQERVRLARERMEEEKRRLEEEQRKAYEIAKRQKEELEKRRKEMKAERIAREQEKIRIMEQEQRMKKLREQARIAIEKQAMVTELRRRINKELKEKREQQERLKRKKYVPPLKMSSIYYKDHLPNHLKDSVIESTNDHYYKVLKDYNLPKRDIPNEISLKKLGLDRTQYITPNIILTDGVINFI